MTTPSRVLFLITSSGTGGAENLFKELVFRLDRSRFEPVFCSLRPTDSTANEIEAAGVPVFSLGMSERPHAAGMARACTQLRSLYRRQEIELVQSSLYRANVLAPLAALGGRSLPRVVTSQHSLAPLKGGLSVFMTRRAHRLSDGVVAVSDAVRRYMIESEGIPGERIAVIPNGVDTERFHPVEPKAARESLGLGEDELVIGAAGRLASVKGFDTLIEAVSRLRSSGMRPTVLIAGEGPEETHLRSLVAKAGLENQIRLLGLRDDLATLYSVFDIFVLSSRREGSPGVVLEAMASECAVLATAVGGVPEIIEDGESGALVPPDDARSLAESMADLLGSEPKRRQLAAKGRARVRREFDLAEITLRYEALYSRLLLQGNAEMA